MRPEMLLLFLIKTERISLRSYQDLIKVVMYSLKIVLYLEGCK